MSVTQMPKNREGTEAGGGSGNKVVRPKRENRTTQILKNYSTDEN